MSDVAAVRRNLPTVFVPQEARLQDAKADAVIQYAKRIADWPTLEQAVDQKIVDLQELVRWWRENVREAHRPGTVTALSQLSTADAEHLTGFTKKQVSRIAKALLDVEKFRARIMGPAYRAAMLWEKQQAHHRTQFTGEIEWYTPSIYIEATRACMGSIDVDPATSEKAQETVRATTAFTISDNGLTQEWPGRVWLNPPYMQPHIANFVEKLLAELTIGRTTQAIMLTHNYTDTAWFQSAAVMCQAICFTRGRVKFISSDGEIAAPTQGQAFFYFGDNVDRFREVFGEFGFIR